MSDIEDYLFIREIEEEDNVQSFSCDEKDVNDFFHNNSVFNNKNLLSKVYILENLTTKEIIGYFALGTYRLQLGSQEKYGIENIPAILLGRIGIDSAYQGQDLGKKYLIKYAVGICSEVLQYIGCRLLIDEVKKGDKIFDYFIKNGFIFEKPHKSMMILSLDLLEIRNTLKKQSSTDSSNMPR